MGTARCGQISALAAEEDYPGQTQRWQGDDQLLEDILGRLEDFKNR